MRHELDLKEIHDIEEKARQLRAEMLANGLKAMVRWLRHPHFAGHGQTA